ncbi:D-Ala-D-Ala carboxypeptidase family metallohydrolase [Antarcticirhabdus aurantiaca]|uniref:Cell wall hydrolase n=1 Tax=Antarcticirhabdus aurantiaca TaxID=2606717 RepID=A0ACD4NPZ0_9HYPH|nr:cell wall hydrolase [Antarcticirhabdus aurantiaca]WAJ28935.1 cell wall hydrolase [Jeongeuplla avenae]
MATADDVFDLAAAVYGEARGEARKGRVAVAHTVVNRARAAGLDVGSVVYGSDQYTALSPRDPNRAKIEKAAKRNDKDWQEAVRVASDVLSGRVPDPTQGATHYHTKSVSPSWGKKLAADGKKVASIGVHTFYSDPVDARRTVQAAARNPVAPIARTPAMLASVPVVGAPAVRADRRLADGFGYQDPNTFAGMSTPAGVPVPTPAPRGPALNGNLVAGRAGAAAYERARLDGQATSAIPTPTPRSTVAGRSGLPAPTLASLPSTVADRMNAGTVPAPATTPAGALAYGRAEGRTRMGSVNAVNAVPAGERLPGLAGVPAPRGATVSSYDRSRLTGGIGGVMDALSAAGFGDAVVNSGHRTKAQNRAAGGARQSQHLHGNALDIDVRGWSDDQKAAMLEAAVGAGARGVGLYSGGNSIHLDSRKSPAVWGAGGSYTGMSVDRAPAWARPTLNAMFSGSPIAPRQGPMPKAASLPADVQARLEAPAMPALTRTAAASPPAAAPRQGGLLSSFANNAVNAAGGLLSAVTGLGPAAAATLPANGQVRAAARPAAVPAPAARGAPQLAAAPVPDLTSRTLPGAAPALPTRNLPGFPTPSSPAPKPQPQAPVGLAGEQQMRGIPPSERTARFGLASGAPRVYGPNLPAPTPAASLPSLPAPRTVGPAPGMAPTPRSMPTPTARPAVSTGVGVAPIGAPVGARTGLGAPAVPAAPRQPGMMERAASRIGNALPSGEQVVGGLLGGVTLGPAGAVLGGVMGREVDRRSTMAAQGYDPTARMSRTAALAQDTGWSGFGPVTSGPVVADPYGQSTVPGLPADARLVGRVDAAPRERRQRNPVVGNVARGALIGGLVGGPVGLVGGGLLGGMFGPSLQQQGLFGAPTMGNGVTTGLLTGRAIPQSVLNDPARYGQGGFTGLGLPSTPRAPSQAQHLKDRDRRGGRGDSGPAMSKSASDSIGKAGAGRGGLW